MVDEAHTLPAKLIDELRLLTNIVRRGEARVRLILAGAASLEQRLANPKLASFQQRIAARTESSRSSLPLAGASRLADIATVPRC